MVIVVFKIIVSSAGITRFITILPDAPGAKTPGVVLRDTDNCTLVELVEGS